LSEKPKSLAELDGKIREFADWLEVRAKSTEEEFRAKGWGSTKVEARAIKEEFERRVLR
jgi:hypothetical protein